MNILFRSSCDAAMREYVRRSLAKRREETREQQLASLKIQMRRDRRSLCRRIAILEQAQAGSIGRCEEVAYDVLTAARNVGQACDCVCGIETRLKALEVEVKDRLDCVEARIFTSEQMCAERKITAAIANDFARLVENYTELKSGGTPKGGNWTDEVSWTRI